MDRRSGITLVELLVVMAILATLAGLGLMVIPGALRSGKASAVRNVLEQMDAALEAYAHDPRNGDYPPTVLDDQTLRGVGARRNDLNMGIEALMICLHRPGTATSFDVEKVPWKDALDNLDQDNTQAPVTTFGADNRQLYELLDPWGTPLAYFHHRDFDAIESKSLGQMTGFDGVVTALPWKNPKTGTWYRGSAFQLISAGPDGVFNSDDDITNFER